MTANEMMVIAEFLGDDMTDEQATRLMDEARKMSIADRERLFNALSGGPLYTKMSMHLEAFRLSEFAKNRQCHRCGAMIGLLCMCPHCGAGN